MCILFTEKQIFSWDVEIMIQLRKSPIPIDNKSYNLNGYVSVILCGYNL